MEEGTNLELPSLEELQSGINQLTNTSEGDETSTDVPTNSNTT